MFKQKVTTDDVFLGMTGKNSSTACCEDIVVSINLLLPCFLTSNSFTSGLIKMLFICP